jgi:hypothetical protein
MNTSTTVSSQARYYELRFRSLFREGRAYSFPCDASGQVAMGALSERAMCNYTYARAMVGHEFYMPEVEVTLQ